MPTYACSSGVCSSGTSSAENDISNIGKIIGIVIGSIIGLAFFIFIIVIIYFAFCKTKRQVWAHPYPMPQFYGQSMPMYPYTGYPQAPMQDLQPSSQKIIEEPPPSYEEISTIEKETEKI